MAFPYSNICNLMCSFQKLAVSERILYFFYREVLPEYVKILEGLEKSEAYSQILLKFHFYIGKTTSQALSFKDSRRELKVILQRF